MHRSGSLVGVGMGSSDDVEYRDILNCTIVYDIEKISDHCSDLDVVSGKGLC